MFVFVVENTTKETNHANIPLNIPQDDFCEPPNWDPNLLAIPILVVLGLLFYHLETRGWIGG